MAAQKEKTVHSESRVYLGTRQYVGTHSAGFSGHNHRFRASMGRTDSAAAAAQDLSYNTTVDLRELKAISRTALVNDGDFVHEKSTCPRADLVDQKTHLFKPLKSERSSFRIYRLACN